MSNTFNLQTHKYGRISGSKNKPLAPPLNFSGLGPRLTTREAAALLRKSPITWQVWRTTGYGPRYLKIGRTVRYLLSDLQEFEQPQNHTSGEAT